MTITDLFLQGIVQATRLAASLFLEFIVARSLAGLIRPEIESSDRRVRNTVIEMR